ncbi:hypothetical protein EIN_019930 [Entamoeba invadens IP1]|uniref:hypothetical protein n=1 Tax=Entamoeba invadens IP1 TaxID=370355 RepID=UPI0002C3EC5C|nr:hypothetical protein EIN_019930 [Entamoeba invadens IP1]ELP90554.1 hypothetical protein EIN_019930 [Entamoeba invadens IP1]|eukprot:XP_004257325.1 hypothetical protein EIN_019930 [Entamoeba invadens IP1]
MKNYEWLEKNGRADTLGYLNIPECKLSLKEVFVPSLVIPNANFFRNYLLGFREVFTSGQIPPTSNFMSSADFSKFISELMNRNVGEEITKTPPLSRTNSLQRIASIRKSNLSIVKKREESKPRSPSVNTPTHSFKLEEITNTSNRTEPFYEYLLQSNMYYTHKPTIDGFEEVDNVTISLRCPFSKSKMTHPVRGVNCLHPIDLKSFVNNWYNKHTDRSKCCVCKEPFDEKDVRIDKGLEKAIRFAPQDAEFVQIINGEPVAFFNENKVKISEKKGNVFVDIIQPKIQVITINSQSQQTPVYVC